jgi:hypothetical protein
MDDEGLRLRNPKSPSRQQRKPQLPSSKFQTNSKSQISNASVTGIQTPFGIFDSLVLGDCLGFGTWDLGFPAII